MNKMVVFKVIKLELNQFQYLLIYKFHYMVKICKIMMIIKICILQTHQMKIKMIMKKIKVRKIKLKKNNMQKNNQYKSMLQNEIIK